MNASRVDTLMASSNSTRGLSLTLSHLARVVMEVALWNSCLAAVYSGYRLVGIEVWFLNEFDLVPLSWDDWKEQAWQFAFWLHANPWVWLVSAGVLTTMALCPARGRLRIGKYCLLAVIAFISLWVLAQDLRISCSVHGRRH